MGSHTIPGVVDAGEGHILLLPYNCNTTPQGVWAIAMDINQGLAFYFNNAGSLADGDNYTLKCYLQAGTYTLRILSAKSNSSAIVDIDIDGVEVASFDLYDASPALYNQADTQANILVAASGLKTITVRVDGRNVASGSWYLNITTLAFWRTA